MLSSTAKFEAPTQPLFRRRAVSDELSRQNEPVLAIDEIQGNILPGFSKDFQTLLFLRIDHPAAFARWLRELVPYIATMTDVLHFAEQFKALRRRQGDESKTVKATWLNIAFSFTGLQKLGSREMELDVFTDKAFTEGLLQRSQDGRLGDPINTGKSGDPVNWMIGGPTNAADVILILASDDRDDLNDLVASIASSLFPRQDHAGRLITSGASIVFRQDGATLSGPLKGHEHFGFRDGISQPGIRGQLPNGTLLTPNQNPLNPKRIGAQALEAVPTDRHGLQACCAGVPTTGRIGQTRVDPPASGTMRREPAPSLAALADKLLRERYVLPSVIINNHGDIVHIHGRTGAYLEPAPGQPRLNIFAMAREGLRLPLTTALHRANTRQDEVVLEGVQVKTNGDSVRVNVVVQRIVASETVRGLLRVSFEPVSEVAPLPPASARGHTREQSQEHVAALERELQQGREALQQIDEELQAAYEECKATSEEMQSTNEELQSASEEMETTKKELQSLNEELQTVNTELQGKVDALSEAHDDMTNLLDSTEIAVIFLDNDLHIKRFTPSATHLGHFIPTDIGRPLRDIVSTLEDSALESEAQEVLRTLVSKEREVHTTTGTWYLMRMRPYRTVRNVIHGLVLTFVDVTRLKQAETFLRKTAQDIEDMPLQEVQKLVHELQIYQIQLEMQNEELRRTQQELQTSRDRYNVLYNCAPVGYVTLDRNGVILEANLTAARLLGTTGHSLIRQGLTDFIVPADQDTFSLHRQQATTQTPQACELMMQRQDGTTLCVHLESLIDVDGAGGAPQWRTTLSDITEQKRAAEALVQQREWLEVTLASIGDAVITTHTDSTITFFNCAAERLTGWSTEEALGRSIDEVLRIVNEDTQQVVENPVLRVLRERRLIELASQTALVTRHGSTIPIAASGTPILSKHGVLHGVVVVIRDLIAHKHLEAHLCETQKMEAIGTLAGGIAHDFNNILAAIIGFTELAQDEVSPSSPTWQSLERVLTAGQRAKELVQQILTFSSHHEPHRQVLRLSLLIQETLQLLRAVLPSTIDIRVFLNTASGSVVANPTQLQQVLMNLVNNAAHAMRTTGGVLEVHLDEVDSTPASAATSSALPLGPCLCLSIRDTGAGMTPEVMARIFEPFFTTKGPDEGTGLGLAVVYGIIASHGGTITVASTPGQGTTFAIYLPRVAAEPPVEGRLAEPLAAGKERILFVDDEEALTKLAREMLGRQGYDVTVSTSSLDALAAFRAAPQGFDLVITDQTMPAMRGETLIHELRRIRSDIPVILCTGYSRLIDAEQAAAVGIDALLMKPVEAATFTRTIQQVLAQRQGSRGQA